MSEISDQPVKPSPPTETISPTQWTALMHRLALQAERSLRWMRKGTVSTDDTVMSTLRTYLRQANRGELPLATDPDSLWPVLEEQLARKIDKAAATQRYLKNRRAIRYSELPPQLDGRSAESAFAAKENSPEEIEACVEQALQLLTESIDDETLLQIARLKLECYTTTEISQKAGLTEHQVRRRLTQIRVLLTDELGSER